MQQRLNNLARDLVGDGNSPNVFFVTNTASGDVVAIFVTEEYEEPIRFADSHTEPLVVEDRLTGVVHDNPASDRIQSRWPLKKTI